MGSCAEMVSWLALLRPAQWYGMNTVSGLIVRTTEARSVQSPRRLSTLTQSPSPMPWVVGGIASGAAIAC